MKVTVLSFLRLGDFFHHVALLRPLQAAGHEITILGFTELAPIVPLFSEFQFSLLNRNELQADLIERDHPWYRAAFHLQRYLSNVSSEKIDLLINLSHTRFSARLMDCFEATEKRGAQYHEGETTGWTAELRDFNQTWSERRQPESGYVDTLAATLGLNAAEPVSAMKKAGHEIWLQPLTSDAKKNWPLSSWADLAKILKSQGFSVRILCAPSEISRLTEAIGPELISAWTFAEIRRQKNLCRSLVSGDTSVLHFAALEGIPCVGIYLGSANAYKTPPRQQGATVIATSLECAPCSHRSMCCKPRHECAELISPAHVAAVLCDEIVGAQSFRLFQIKTDQQKRAFLERLGGKHEQEARGAFAKSTQSA